MWFNTTPSTLAECQELIRQNVLGKTLKIKGAAIGGAFINSAVSRFIELQTASMKTNTQAGRIWSILDGVPFCQVCKVKARGYFNGLQKSCGDASCVRTLKSVNGSIACQKNGRSEKQTTWAKAHAKTTLNIAGRATLLKKHGVANAFCIPSIRKKALEGAAIAVELRKEKLAKERLDRWQSKFNINIKNIELSGNSTIEFSCNDCSIHDTKTFYALQHRQKKANVSCSTCGSFKSGSIEQAKLFTLVKQHYCSAEQNNRKVLAPFEVDIWVPELNLGIEYHGIFWHSAKLISESDRQYHQKKYLLAKEKGIKLIQIWSHWDETKVKSLIAHHLHLDRRVFARQTRPAIIDKDVAKKFLNEHHLDNSIGGRISVGLFLGNELQMVAVFGKSRFSAGTELLRLSSRGGVTVVGGVSKIISFAKRVMNVDKIITFAKLELGGTSYLKAGGIFLGYTPPAESWINLKTGRTLSRLAAQKHRLEYLLGEHFDKSKTGHKNLEDAGFRVFWSAGNAKFEL